MLRSFNMTSQRELTKINRLLHIIENNSPISKVELVMKSGLSISYFEKLKPFLEEIYVDKVRYDKSTKCWSSIIPKDVINSDKSDPNEVSKN